ncbi:hypothetical protein niasHT_008547 [Heterodera trifolii]|uniref:Uncharacterized protein n=1 Tax=Heterodera trifolii TaxID=157864 RepID=A0ABD2MCB1_9BILA
MPSKKYQSTNSMPRMDNNSHININDAVNYAKKTNKPGYQSPYYTPTRSPIKNGFPFNHREDLGQRDSLPPNVKEKVKEHDSLQSNDKEKLKETFSTTKNVAVLPQAKKAVNANNANEMSLSQSDKFNSEQPEELRQESEEEEEETSSSLEDKKVLNFNHADQNGQYKDKNTVLDTPKEDCLTLDFPAVFEKIFVEKKNDGVRKK